MTDEHAPESYRLPPKRKPHPRSGKAGCWLVLVVILFLALALLLVGCGGPAQAVPEVGCPPRPRANAPTVGVLEISEDARMIWFSGPPELIDDLSEFGNIWPSGTYYSDSVLLVNTATYDFGEVVAYIENWEECRPDSVVVMPTPEITTEAGEIDLSGFDDIVETVRLDAEAGMTLEIDWSGSIIVTNALSQTFTMPGPVTVRFGGEDD